MPQIGKLASSRRSWLVHGAFADASKLERRHRAAGTAGLHRHRHGQPAARPGRRLAYTASLLNQIDGPVLLVGHSYAGAVITNAATSTPNVVGLVYIAAFATEEGENLNDVESGSKDSILGAALVQYKYPADRTGRLRLSSRSTPRCSARPSQPTCPRRPPH